MGRRKARFVSLRSAMMSSLMASSSAESGSSSRSRRRPPPSAPPNAARRVEERPAADGDEAGVGPYEPGDGLQGLRLARAGRAEEDRHAGRRAEVNVEREALALETVAVARR